MAEQGFAGGEHVFERINIHGEASVHMGNIVQQNIYISVNQQLGTPEATSLPPQFWGVRSCSSRFTGMSRQLELLHSWFLLEDTRSVEQNAQHKIIVIFGDAGCGKTQLARKFAHISQDLFRGIFWIDASTKKIAENAFAALGHEFGKGDSFESGFNWLRVNKEKWLLILDNADQTDPNDFNIEEVIPPGNHGHVLITTRVTTLADDVANAGSLLLGDMPTTEAADLLLRWVFDDLMYRSDHQNQLLARQIAHKIRSKRAIAVDKVGRFIRHGKLTLEVYLSSLAPKSELTETDEYQFDSTFLDGVLPPEATTTENIGYTSSAENPVAMAVDGLRASAHQTEAHWDAACLLQIFTFFHYSGVSMQVFVALWTSNQSPWTSGDQFPEILRPGQRSLEVMQERFKTALAMLYDFAIVETISFEDAHRSCYTMHPLVQSWSQDRIKKTGSKSIWLRRAMHVLTSSLPAEVDNLDMSSALSMMPHLVRCVTSVHEVDAEKHLSETGQYLDLHQQDLSDALRDEHLRRNNDLELREAQNSFMFDEEGALLYEKIASIYDTVAWWSEAGSLYRKALIHRRFIRGSRDELTMRIERRLMTVQLRTLKLEDCVRTQLSLLFKWWLMRPSWMSWIMSPLQPNHIPFYDALTDLAAALHQSGRYMPSWRIAQYTLKGYTKWLGNNDDRTLSAQSIVGKTLLDLGYEEAAHRVLRDVVIRRKNHLDAEKRFAPAQDKETSHKYYIDAQWSRLALATSLQRRFVQGELGRAPLWKSIAKCIAENIYKERQLTLGDAHPYTFFAMFEYVKILCMAGEAEKAVLIIENDFPTVGRVLENQGTALQMGYANLARAYAYAGRWAKAADTMAMVCRMVPPSSPGFFSARFAYARLELRAGFAIPSPNRLEAAGKQLRILLEKQEPLLRKGIRDTATNHVLQQLAFLYGRAEQQDQLKQLKQRFPDLDENMPQPPISQLFETQPTENNPVRVISDLVSFVFVKNPQNPLGAMLVKFWKWIGATSDYHLTEQDNMAFEEKLGELDEWDN